MTDREFNVLCAFRDGEIRNISGFNPEDRAVITSFAERGYLQRYIRGAIRIKELGLTALTAEEERREHYAQQQREEALQKQTEDKRHRKDARRSWVQLGIQVAVSLFTLFLGAYLAGQTTFMDWFLRLFK